MSQNANIPTLDSETIKGIEENLGAAGMGDMTPIGAELSAIAPTFSEDTHICIDYKDGGRVYVPFTEYPTEDGVSKSISAIKPMENEVLVGEYGRIGLMRLLNESKGVKSNDPVSASLIIIGVGDKVPAKFKLGMQIIPRNTDNMSVRDTWDPTNLLSYPALIDHAKKNPALLAASSIAASKDRSALGLNLNSTFINKEAIADAEKKLSSPTSKFLFQDEKVNFLNYKLTDYRNIAAVIVK